MKPATGQEFIEIRCNKDNTLLFRARQVSSGEIEVKCRRCREVRTIRFPFVNQRSLQKPFKVENQSLITGGNKSI